MHQHPDAAVSLREGQLETTHASQPRARPRERSVHATKLLFVPCSIIMCPGSSRVYLPVRWTTSRVPDPDRSTAR